MKFKIANKYSGEVFSVYDVKIKNGNLKFLIFDSGEWMYIDANSYMPFEEEGFRP